MPRVDSRANPKGALTVLFITVFLDLMGFGLIIPILPIFAKELGANGLVIGVVASSYSFMQFMFSGFWGSLSDRIGRRPVILISIVIMVVAYIVFANAGSIAVLLISRLLSGLGAANLSAAQAFISDVSTPDKKAKNFGLIGAAFGLGFIVGPPLGGWLKDSFGIEWVGYTAAIFSVANFLLAYFILPESLLTKNSTSSLWQNPFGNMVKVLRQSAVNQFFIINIIFITAFSMMQITAAILWHEKFRLSDAEVGYTFAFIGALAVVIQGSLLGKFTARFSEKSLLATGNLLMAVGLLAMPYIPVEWFVPLELLALALIGFGNAFINPMLSSLLSTEVSALQQGFYLGILQSSGSLARLIGPVIGGSLYDVHYTMPYVASFGLMLMSFYFSLKLSKKH
ncbi:MAG: MFS transporter [Thermaurantimonas sp.]|uniref:MFS transporter n=1 Tax=Thermaurantimonas sp. TaxID=2681568 RepID=UPI0039191B7F